MRDPHVGSLKYSVQSDPGTKYVDPPPVQYVTALGTFRVADGSLSVVPAEHFSTEGDARAAIEPFLKAWEIDTELRTNPGTIRFVFESADVVDRNPPTDSGVVLYARGAVVSVSGGAATVTIGRHTYPDPPRAFRLTPEVEIAFRRWRAYREGAEPLPSMAYFVLTLVEKQAGSRASAAHVFAIHEAILKTIGRLSSERGDAANARKASKSGAFWPLSGAEASWLEAAVRRVILRLGEHAAGVPLTTITKADLPL